MKKLMKLLSVAVLSLVTCFMLFACAPADADKAKEKMEEAGYTVTVVDGDAAAAMADGAVAYVNATKLDISLGSGFDADGEMVSAVLFENSKSAKAYWDDHKDDIEDEEEDGWESKLSGKWIVTGTEEAVKAFMK